MLLLLKNSVNTNTHPIYTYIHTYIHKYTYSPTICLPLALFLSFFEIYAMNQDTFEKISFDKVVPIRRTSEQSILSSLSLKSNLISKSNRITTTTTTTTTTNTNNDADNENIGVKLPFNSINHNNSDNNNNNNNDHNNSTTTTTTITAHNNDTSNNFNIQSLDTVDDDYDSGENNSSSSSSASSTTTTTININITNNTSDDLTKQALRKLSFLKITGSDDDNIQAASNDNKVRDDIKLSNSSSSLQSTDSNLTPKKTIKQVSSFLNTNTPYQNITKNSSSSSISSVDTLRNPQNINNLRNLHNNTPRSIMKSNPSFSMLYNKSLSTPPLSVNTLPNSTFSNTNNNTRILSKQYIKQINNPKRPMYIPAVLRNVSETNLTNDDILTLNSSISQMPTTLLASTHSLYNHTNSISVDSYLTNYNSNNTHNVTNFSRTPLSIRSSSISSNSSITTTSSSFSNSIRHIKTSHWIPDSMRSNCNKCNIQFTLWERRHHCRHCGELFCRKDLLNKLYLNCDAQFISPINFTGKKFLSKVCDSCYYNYKQYLNINNTTFTTTSSNQDLQPKQLIIQNNQTSQTDLNFSQNDDGNDTLTDMTSVSAINKKKVKYKNDTIVGSVSNWNWSSF